MGIKKIVIADTLSPYAGRFLGHHSNFRDFRWYWQRYCLPFRFIVIFPDIAIGTAKLLRINLMTNFKSPYFSRSLREFWSRWHISLSTWFRDYVYIPLGGNQVGKIREALNLFVTFLISGLWHEENRIFVLVGGVHGIAQIIEKLITHGNHQTSKGCLRLIRIDGVFCFCFFAWIFFASTSLSDAIYIITHMLDGISDPGAYFHNDFSGIGLGKMKLASILISILYLMIYDYVSMKKDVISIISSKKIVIRWGIYILGILWVIFNLPVSAATEFIYFQF